MDELNKAVETNDQVAATDLGVETSHSPAPENDPEARIAALIAENEKLARDRDNYRNATLALKGKAELSEVDLTDPAQMAAFVQKQIQEGLVASRATEVNEELNSYAKDLARKNKELALALANKKTMVAAGQGTSDTGVEPPKSAYFSADQLNALKAKGYDDAKIKKLEDRMRQGVPLM